MKINTLSIQNQKGEKTPLFTQTMIANSFFLRLKGLLGRTSLSEAEALIISPCRQVHTVGMRMTIDVIFVDKNKRVTKIVEELTPYRQAANSRAHSVIEVATGMIKQHNIAVGCQLTW